jgi:hypothetical protein
MYNIDAACKKLISLEEIMEIIRRDFLWLSGLALAAPPAGNIVATQAHAQATPKLTQILRQDLEGQDHTVQETVASIVEFPTGRCAMAYAPECPGIASRDRGCSHGRNRRPRKDAVKRG